MLKIKNQLVNTKELKRQKKLKKYVEIKKKIRLKTKKFFPLTRQEEILYNDHKFKSHITKLSDEEFFKIAGNIVLLDIFPKSDLKSFLSGIKKLLFNNPATNAFINYPIDSDWENRMAMWQNSNNSAAYGLIDYCSPKSKDLIGLIDSIRIDIFNFSNDYFGISFNLYFSDTLKDELNTDLIDVEKYDTDIYKKYSYGHKKYIGKYSYNSAIIRKNNFDNKLIEIKCRVHKFISKYINLSPIDKYSPISLDFYYTNIRNVDSMYYKSFDLYLTEKDIYSDIPIIHNSSKGGQEFINHDYILPLFISYNTINRSTPLLILDDTNRYSEIHPEIEDLLDIFIIVLYMHLLNEFDFFISKERNLVEQNYLKFGIKFNHYYNKLSAKVFKFNLIFNDVCMENFTLPKEKIKTFHKYLNKAKANCLNKHQLFESASQNKITISNYNVSFWLSFISIIIAIVALITSLFYNSTPNYDNEINIISQEQKIIYEELKNIENIEKNIIDSIQ